MALIECINAGDLVLKVLVYSPILARLGMDNEHNNFTVIIISLWLGSCI